MAAPTIDPATRNPSEVAPTDSYQPADRVWIYRGGTWRSGVVETSSSRAATVTYRPGDAGGTAVDTLTARYLVARLEEDPALDQRPASTADPSAPLQRRPTGPRSSAV